MNEWGGASNTRVDRGRVLIRMQAKWVRKILLPYILKMRIPSVNG